MKPSFLRLLTLSLGVAVAQGQIAPAYAQAKKPAAKKKAGAAADTKDKNAGDAKAAAAPAAKKPEERKGPASFARPSREFDARKEEMADKKRDEAIEQLKKIIPKIDDGSPQKADLLFQLSELYWEKQKYLAMKGNKQFGEAIEKFEEARNRGEKLPEPKFETFIREAELYRSETMRLYETILRDYPAYQRKDEVLFALGYNLYELGKKAEAVKRYEELAKNYPDSKFLADTYVQLANHWFDNNSLEKARTNYEKALKTQSPEIYSYALYKLAWCDFNAGTYEAALKKFHDVIDYSEQHKQSDLKNEALRDMVLTYVQLNRPDDAVAYFKRKAPKKRQSRLIASLADGLLNAGNFDSSIKVYRGLINDEPMRADAPDFQQSIIRAYDKMRARDQVKIEVKRLAELYRPGSEWWKANESRPPVLKNAFAVAEEAMRSVVTDYHQEAQKTKQVETYRLARDIYKQYVDSFASSDNPDFVSDFAFNMKYYYADILWALDEWDAAAKEYESIVKFKIPARDSAKEVSQEKYRIDSAHNAILAYAKLVKIERGELTQTELKEGQKIDEKKKKGDVEKQKKVTKRSVKELQEQPLTKNEQKLVEVCDLYNNLFPGNQDEIDVRYQAAVIYYDRNHFVEAGHRFADIINKWPEERRSREAADLTMAVLEEKEEWLELNKIARSFGANKKLVAKDPEFGRRTAGIIEGSQYKYVDEVVYKKEKNPKKAAELFLDFVKEFPKSDNADRALTYAMIIFKDANELDRGIEAGERVLKEYPESPFDLKVRFTLAKFYEQTAQFRKSAEMNEAFIAATDLVLGNARDKNGKKLPARKYKAKNSAEELKALKDEAGLCNDKTCWLADAHFNAALWWEGLGEYDKAIADYKAYMERWKDKQDVPEIFFNIGLIYEKQKKWDLTAKQFEQYVTTYGKDKRVTPGDVYRAKFRTWKAYKELKNDKELAKLQAELLKGYASLSAEEKKDLRILNAYAHMRFLEAEPVWKNYTDLKFSKVATIKKDFAEKQKRIVTVQKTYTDILAIGDGEYGIASLTRIGLAYADFSQDIIDSPDPKGLDDEQLEMYRSELENMAFPLEEKAIEALEKATAKAYELNIYNEWTLLAQDKINKYRPGFYAKPIANVSYQGAEFFVTAPVEKQWAIAEKAAPPATPPAAQDQKTEDKPSEVKPTAAAGQP